MATFHSLLQMIAEYIWRICGGMESRFVRIVVLFLRSIHTNGGILEHSQTWYQRHLSPFECKTLVSKFVWQSAILSANLCLSRILSVTL